MQDGKFSRVIALLLMLSAGLTLAGCDKAARLSSDEELVLERATQIAIGINTYHSTHGTAPEEIGEVEQLLPDMVAWPQNVFTGAPMIDTKSREFDAAASPGNVCYNKVMREEQIVVWELHVFGEKETVRIITALDAAELERELKR